MLTRYILWVCLAFGGCGTLAFRPISSMKNRLTCPFTKTSLLPLSLTRTEPVTQQPEELLLLEEQHQVAGPIASSFEPRQFRPLPFLSNRHVQTVGSFLVRDIPDCQYVSSSSSGRLSLLMSPFRAKKVAPPSFEWDVRTRIVTPDGDWFHVDVKHSNKSKGLVLMLHGLESNSNSSLCHDMARAFGSVGLDVHCLNFRGCSGTPNDTLGGYHLGFTDDLQHYLNLLKEGGGVDQPIYLAGFSLGANAVLKCLGELQASAVTDYNIQGAVALCVPLDAAKNAPCLGAPGFNRAVYTRNLLRTLQQRCADQLERYCGGNEQTTQFDYPRAMAAETITEFDDAFVAPIYGFDSAYDYYQKTSSVFFLPNITVPTLILNAQDDPFMDPHYWPVELTHEHGGRAPVKMVATPHGGHLGYIFHQVEEGQAIPATSWAPTELARFLQHVHDSNLTD